MSTEENKALTRRLLEEPWKNLDVVDELVDSNYVAYDPAVPAPIRGPEGAKQNFSTYLTAFEGAHITVDDQIAEGDKVVSRWTGRGTHQAELMGIAPTGKPVTVSGITISRLANGKVVEEWINWDTLGMLQQIGAFPTPGQATREVGS